ncbi:hypothetical protein [Catenuloplanes atrovinosus]|uniref:Uncharacterized protein n=1 Tax=Catenuloplanes atrovinosus TaxID=137266 RepID=A0AAE3YV03_9ACTN|nr:hypothetical protein [Catenuloplanes atrovinosus]MDR7279122.1 hypothetical protein [Catenuloplanes atrovinosus]
MEPVALGAEWVIAERVIREPSGRDPGNGAGARLSRVRCGRPLIYPVPVGDLPAHLRRRAAATGTRYAGMLLAFDLEEPPGRSRITMARFSVAMSDSRVVAVDVHADGDALGLFWEDRRQVAPSSDFASRTVEAARDRRGWLDRLMRRRGAPRVFASGLLAPHFGWTYHAGRGERLASRSYGMHALLEIPPDLAEVSGTLDVQIRTDAGFDGVLGDAVPFAERTGAPPMNGRRTVRLCMAADVVGYSARRTDQTRRVQRELVDVLRGARETAGIAESEVEPQPQGDGQFTVLPLGIDEAVVIPRLVGGLARGLRTVPSERIRVRVALHRGLVEPGANGWVGVAPIAVHRILDSRPLHDAIRDHPAADFVLGVPDVLYRDVIAHSAEPPGAGDFSPAVVDLPDKDFLEHCWVHVGAPR